MESHIRVMATVDEMREAFDSDSDLFSIRHYSILIDDSQYTDEEWEKVKHQKYPFKVIVRHTSVPECDDEDLILVMEIHSHHVMPCSFSSTDNEDEKAMIIRITDGFPLLKKSGQVLRCQSYWQHLQDLYILHT